VAGRPPPGRSCYTGAHYSPHDNPVERIWGALKAWLANARTLTIQGRLCQVHAFFRARSPRRRRRLPAPGRAGPGPCQVQGGRAGGAAQRQRAGGGMTGSSDRQAASPGPPRRSGSAPPAPPTRQRWPGCWPSWATRSLPASLLRGSRPWPTPPPTRCWWPRSAGRSSAWPACTSRRSSTRAAAVAGITALVVDPSQRGRGAGRHLLEAMEAATSRRSCGAVELTTSPHRHGPHRFYLAAGYQDLARSRPCTISAVYELISRSRGAHC
jgi:Acetyltransferase (GNAT) family